ncbi:DUF3566 domain-containing protein [Cumulibacter soli]|uniref:DUF3566 domain-containing protein n=1 Tax=Cumulibacter soli TaxID=2546344 RepID=UPI001FBC0DB3|nr:DUF3566 domain-containing protein [Cumulibacter soli]
MTKAKDTASDDWLSAPVGNSGATGSAVGSGGDAATEMAPAAASAGNSVSESVTSTGSKYKSSFTKNLAGTSGSLYPGATAGGASPALDAEQGPGPATSVGLGSAPSVTATAAPSSKKSRRAAAGPRRAKLQIRHIDPWSTLKLSLVLAVAFFFVWMIAVAILYGVLSTMGVFESVDEMFAELGGDATNIVTPKIVFGGAALIGAINIVLFTALATIGAYIYNLCADLAGGLEITLAERR